jgi:hypothetical protein
METTEIGINTSELDPEELRKLVENNPELMREKELSNVDHKSKEEIEIIEMNNHPELIQQIDDKLEKEETEIHPRKEELELQPEQELELEPELSHHTEKIDIRINELYEKE